MPLEPWDIVVVPFPFTDRQATKRRPALVLSDPRHFDIGHSLLAMITSRHNAPWPLDVPISRQRAAGLAAPSIVRMKLFTLDHRLVPHHRDFGMFSDVARVRGKAQRVGNGRSPCQALQRSPRMRAALPTNEQIYERERLCAPITALRSLARATAMPADRGALCLKRTGVLNMPKSLW